jgi:hypothetical protein
MNMAEKSVMASPDGSSEKRAGMKAHSVMNPLPR